MTSPQYQIPGYQLLQEIGAGGMATVFLALQVSLDRQVAIKVMRRAGADESFEKRFLLEGRTMAKLPHRNIVGVYDIVQSESINYIAMEYLGGGTLSERLQEGLSLAEAIAIVVQIAAALQFAHDGGVVHRDLKPANIMFRDRFTPVLTDFGIARQYDAEATRLTQTGMMIGTPTYMSPEQAMGGSVDGRSDQYSLGVLFYEMLTGAPPFAGDTPLNVVLAHLHQPPPPLPPHFAHFQPLMDRLLAKQPDQRYPDLKNFTAELKSLLTHSDTLMARLRIDPDQSASEQLRALGFSESQINTGSGSTPSALAAAVGASRTGAAGTGGASAVRATGRGASGPGVRMDPQPTRARSTPPRPRWLLPAAGGALALMLLVVVAVFLFRGDELDPSQRRVVDIMLAQVDRLIAEDKLITPPKDNAFEVVQDLQQLYPGLPESDERLARIAARLREQAERALQAGEFATAEARAGEALAVHPDDQELVALRDRVGQARIAAERAGEVRALLQQARAAEVAGRALGEGNDTALAYLRQAEQLLPDDAAVKQQLDALRERALKPARDALAAGRLEEANGKLVAVAGFFAGDRAWQTLRADIDRAVEVARHRERIAGLLAEADRQLQRGRLAEPAGDNALETLARVRELDPRNERADALRRDIGQRLATQAAQAEKRGEDQLALSLYEGALQARPDEAAYAAARQALEQRLGERQTQISRALAAAREAIAQRRFLDPDGNSARHHLQAVLALDAGNAEARRLIAELPRLIRDTAAELARERRHDAAVALLQRALKDWPDDRDIAMAASELVRERDRLAAASTREQRLGEVRELLAQRQLNPDTARAISHALRQLLEADAKDPDALAYRETFVQGIARVITAAQSPETLAQLEPILAQVRAQLGSKADIASLDNHFKLAGERLAEAERARVAASSGLLVLNAQPWANVASVTDQGSGRAIALPKDASTPLRLTLPAGTYRVAFRHPSAQEPVLLVASVEAQRTATLAARFPTLSAERFLRDAGWSP